MSFESSGPSSNPTLITKKRSVLVTYIIKKEKKCEEEKYTEKEREAERYREDSKRDRKRERKMYRNELF